MEYIDNTLDFEGLTQHISNASEALRNHAVRGSQATISLNTSSMAATGPSMAMD